MSTTNAPAPEVKPHIKIPAEVVSGAIRFVAYTLVMGLLLIPFLHGWQLVCGAAILGHFSGLLNKIEQGK